MVLPKGEGNAPKYPMDRKNETSLKKVHKVNSLAIHTLAVPSNKLISNIRKQSMVDIMHQTAVQGFLIFTIDIVPWAWFHARVLQ